MATDYTNLISGAFGLNSKVDSLNTAKQNKLDKLQYKKDNLLGMSDADSLTTTNFGSTRSQSTDGTRYDANEVAHGDSPFMGIGTDFEKSKYSRGKQIQSTAKLLGISPYDVTDQDIKDVGNMQTIQKLADISRGENDPRWVAPLIRNSEDVNLSGSYTDETGQNVNIPLNVPINTAATGVKVGNRELASFQAPGTGINVTNEAAKDPRLNAFATELKSNIKPTGKPDWDQRAGETIDLLQSQGLKLWGDMSVAARKLSRSAVKAIGVDPDSIGLTADARLLGTDKLMSTIRTNQKVRDELTGFSTRPEWEVEKQKMMQAVGDDKYGEAAWSVVTNLDRYLAESAPETAVLMVPYAGLPSIVGTRLSNQMEEFEANNNRPMTSEEMAQTGAGIFATLIPEKLLIKTGATKTLEAFASKTGKGKKLAMVGGAAVGEGLQEAAENIQETYQTQKVGEQTLGEIATSDETKAGALAGAVIGGSLSGTAAVASTAADKLKESKANRNNKATEEIAGDVKASDKSDINSVKTANNNATQNKSTASDLLQMDSIDASGEGSVSKTSARVRDRIINNFTTTEMTEDSIKLGSSAEAEAVIEMLLASGKDTDILSKNIDSIAKANDVSEETVKALKDRYSVEEEATTGSIGYKTLGRQLRRFNADPKQYSKELDKVVTRLQDFRSSQEKARDIIGEFIKRAEAKYDEGSFIGLKMALKSKEYKTLSGKPLVIHKSSIAAMKKNGKRSGIYTILDDKINNIDGINKELGSVNLAEEFGETDASDIIVEEALDVTPTKKEAKPVKKTSKSVEEVVESAPTEEVVEEIVEEAEETSPVEAGKITPEGVKHVYGIIRNKGVKPSEYTKKEKKDIAQAKADGYLPKILKVFNTEVTKAEGLMTSEDLMTEAEQKFLDELPNGVKATAKRNIKKAMKEELDFNNTIKLVRELQEAINNGDKEAESQLNDVLNGDIVDTILENSITEGKADSQITKTVPLQVIDINKLVTKKRGTTVNSLDNSQMGFKVKKYISKAVKSLTKTISPKATGKNKRLQVDNETRLEYNSPSRGLIYDKDGNVNENVALAMKLAVDEYIAYNSNMINRRNKSREDTARMVGKLSVSKEQHDFLKDKGVFQKTMANNIGANIMSQLGLVQAEGSDSELYGKLVADLGNAAVLTAISDDTLEFHKVPSNLYAGILETAVTDNAGEADILFVRESKTAATRRSDFTTPISDVRNKYETIADELAVESSNRKAPRTKKISLKSSKNKGVRRNEVVERPDTADTVLEKLMGEQYTMDMDSVEWVRDNQDLVRTYMNYSTPEAMSKMSYEYADSAVSKNREIDKSIDELLRAEDKPMYFDWFYSSNGRYMLDSNTVNPQTDKLHRFLVTPREHIVTLDKNNAEHMEMFNYAIAQAFGYAVDKKSSDSIQELGEAIKSTGSTKLQKALEDGTLNGMEVGGKELEVEHLGHVLQALKALKAYEGNATTFTSNISAEFDAVTSGFGLKLLQMPIIGNSVGTSMQWMKKTGIFVNAEVDSMNNVLSKDGFLDSYQQLASEVKGITPRYVKDRFKLNKVIWKDEYSDTLKQLQKMLPKVSDDGEVSGELRALFKDPFMTFNYSAGMRSIKQSLSGVINGKVVNELASKNKAYKKLDRAISPLLYNPRGLELSEMLKKSSPSNIYLLTAKGQKSTLTLERLLDNMVTHSYGAKVEDIMTNNFGQFVEVHESINNSFKVMFEVFKLDYDKQVNELEVKNEEAKLKILHGLRNKFPIIQGPLSDGDLAKGIAIFSKKNVNIKDQDLQYLPAQTQVNKDEFGQESFKIRQAIKEFEAAASAGSVIPIHYIDAAIIAKPILGNKGIVSIHDAIIPPLTSAKSAVRDYNKGVYDVNKDYSFTDSISQMLTRSAGLAKTDKIVEIRVAGEKVELPLDEAYQEVSYSMNSLNNRVQKARDLLFGYNMDIVHMASVEGTKFSKTQDNVKNVGTLDTNNTNVVVVDSIKNATDGTHILAKNRNGVIEVSGDKALWKAYFDEKRWNTPRKLKDGSKIKAMSKDVFSSPKEFRDFVMRHEVAHNYTKIKPNESRGDYETRVNDVALRQLGLFEKAYDLSTTKSEDGIIDVQKAKDSLNEELKEC